MAQITIQHGCGHDRVIETPGPDDPEGLLARHAQVRGAVHRAPASRCPDCEAAQPVAFPIEPLSPEAAADAPLEPAPADLQTSANADGAMTGASPEDTDA